MKEQDILVVRIQLEAIACLRDAMNAENLMWENSQKKRMIPIPHGPREYLELKTQTLNLINRLTYADVRRPTKSG